MEHLPNASMKRTLDIDFGIDMTMTEVMIDGGDFPHFPERHRTSKTETRTSNLLISWWYFQLLASQLNPTERTQRENLINIVIRFTVVQKSGNLMLNTTGLVTWLKAIARRYSKSDAWHRDTKSYGETLDSSRQVITTDLIDMQSQSRFLTSGQQLAIVLLVEALDHAQHFELLASNTALDLRNAWGHISIPAIEQQMLPALGCMNRVHMSRSRFSWSYLLYAGSLRYPLSDDNHSACTETQCRTCEVESQHHSLRHLDRCHGCGHFGPSISLLENLVTSGKTPLVKLDSLLSCDVLDLEPLDSDICYVAFSHVWSQLFGHDLGNFLPWCQLHRLHSWASALTPKPTHVWLDIICVPRMELSLRAVGIAQIKGIVEAANHVLVLDESLINSTFDLRLWEETLVRICISQWMRRLWTLHEAVLASNLSFQFTNGPFYLNSLSASNLVQKDNLRYNTVGAVAFARLQEPNKFCYEPDGATRMARLWNMLRWRSTSWPEQETVCLFNMLHAHRNLSEPMSDVPVRLHMEKLLRMYDFFPADLIFMDGPRIETDGYGWSPASWLTRNETSRQQQLIQLPISSIGKRTPAGLNVRYAGTCLQYKVNELIENWQLYSRIQFTDQFQNENLVRLPDVVCIRIQSLYTELATQRIAIVYDKNTSYQSHDCMDARKGALVALRPSSDMQYTHSQTHSSVPRRTRFLCTVEITRPAKGHQHVYAGEISCQPPYLKLMPAEHVNYWCIG